MFYGHRDTWYANPQVMLTWWIPLHDVAAEETFEFMPEAFATAVRNESRDFRLRRLGARWAGETDRVARPANRPDGTLLATSGAAPREGAVSFSACAGDILLFSGSAPASDEAEHDRTNSIQY